MQKFPNKMLLIPAVLLCYPAALFLLKGGMNGLFFLTVALSFIAIFRSRHDHPAYFDRLTIAFSIAMLSGIFAIFLSQAYHGSFNPRPYDAASRFLLAIPIYLALKNADIKTLSYFQYGLPMGAIAALIITLLLQGHTFYSGRASTSFMHPIYFGDMALILGALSLFSINWLKQDGKSVIALKILGGLAGIYVSVLSQSRGGWISIPIFLAIWLVFQNQKRTLVKLSFAFPMLLVILLANYFLVDIVQQRIDSIFYDLSAFSKGQTDTSVGQRLQLWKAALYLYGNNPLFGVGPEGFADSMTMLNQSGLITKEAADLGKGEVHNHLLANLVGLGIPGILAALSIYFVPLYIFIRATKSRVNAKRTAGIMGVCLTLGFFIFGLTAEIFNIKMIVSFYSLTLAVLLAGATRKEEDVL